MGTSGRLPRGLWLFPVGSVLDMVAAIVLAEAQGLDEIWLGDEGPAGWDPFVILAAAAVQTRRISLNIGVSNPVTRHPGATALAAMTVNELSGGRVTLGFGIGGSYPLAPFGFPSPSARIGDVVRALVIARGVADGVVVDGYAPPQSAMCSPSLRLAIGSRGPKLNAAAAPLVDALFFSGISMDDAPALVAGARAAGPVDLHWYRTVGSEDGELRRQDGTISGPLIDIALATHSEGVELGANAVGLALWGGSALEQVQRSAGALLATGTEGGR
jgi:5,10-methylenetetrahydromethanopterin reductase